jgi:hypothetical protein
MNPKTPQKTAAKRQAVELMLAGRVHDYLQLLTRVVAQAPRSRA